MTRDRRANHFGLPQVPVISIIEDDASVRCAMHNLVRSLGFTACTYACAEDFLRSQRLDDTACIIADVQMPGLSGVELQSVLLSQGRRTPFIFITAFNGDAVRTRAMKAGAVAFLSKPVEGSTLIQCLDKALTRGRGQQQRPQTNV
jgi:FixJ family two-component response regulator